jgi:hypothetical protein
MNDSKLYTILDLIEEISKLDKMIHLHKKNESDFMLNQYSSKKLKLTSFLIKELTTGKENSDETMYLVSLFLNKFYSFNGGNKQFTKDDKLLKIKELVS